MRPDQTKYRADQQDRNEHNQENRSSPTKDFQESPAKFVPGFALPYDFFRVQHSCLIMLRKIRNEHRESINEHWKSVKTIQKLCSKLHKKWPFDGISILSPQMSTKFAIHILLSNFEARKLYPMKQFFILITFLFLSIQGFSQAFSHTDFTYISGASVSSSPQQDMGAHRTRHL